MMPLKAKKKITSVRDAAKSEVIKKKKKKKIYLCERCR